MIRNECLSNHLSCSYYIELGPPDNPILTGNTGDMTEGIPERLECKAKDGFPEGDFRWYINDQEITETFLMNRQNANGRYDVISNITFSPTRSNNGSHLKCSVTHTTMAPGEERSVSVELNIKCKTTRVTSSMITV